MNPQPDTETVRAWLRTVLQAPSVRVQLSPEEAEPWVRTVRTNLLGGGCAIAAGEREGGEFVLARGPVERTPLPTVACGGDPGDALLGITREAGGFCVHRGDGDWLNLLPFGWRPQVGPVAILSSSNPVAAALARACASLGVGSSFLASLGPSRHVRLHHWLDAAGRHPDIAVIAIYADSYGDARRMAEVARAVAEHVPIVVLLPAPGDSDPWLDPWLRSCGVIAVDGVQALAATVAALADLEPPSLPDAVVVSDDVGLGVLTARRIDSERLGAAKPSRFTLASGAQSVAEVVGLELASSSGAVTVVVLSEPAEAAEADATARALAAVRQTHRESALIVVGAGEASWATHLRGALEGTGTPVLPSFDEVVPALTALHAWEDRRQTLHAPPAPRAADPPGARRLLGAIGRGEIDAPDPRAAAELLAALGIAAAPWRSAGFVEDGLVAAMEYGYPVRLTWQDGSGEVIAEIAADSEMLRRAFESLALRGHLRGIQRPMIGVHSIPPGSFDVAVSAFQHPRYGPVIELSHGSSSLRFAARCDGGAVRTWLRESAPSELRTDAHVASLTTVGDLLASSLGLSDGIRLLGAAPMHLCRAGCLAGPLLIGRTAPAPGSR